MIPQHSKEPWHILDTGAKRFINDAEGRGVASTSVRIEYPGDAQALAEVNAERIVACVNACSGIPTDQLAPANEVGREWEAIAFYMLRRLSKFYTRGGMASLPRGYTVKFSLDLSLMNEEHYTLMAEPIA